MLAIARLTSYLDHKAAAQSKLPTFSIINNLMLA